VIYLQLQALKQILSPLRVEVMTKSLSSEAGDTDCTQCSHLFVSPILKSLAKSNLT